MIKLPQFPEAPTDNLYKFIAIFGLALLLVGAILPTYITYSEKMNYVETMAKVKALENEMLVAGDFEILEEFKTEKVRTSEEVERFNAKVRDFTLKNGQAVAELERFNARNPFAVAAADNIRILYVIGAFLVAFGFVLWYYKLQRYQDLIIKNQAETKIKVAPKRRFLRD
jgi:membrane-bound ClpP family serine protease